MSQALWAIAYKVTLGVFLVGAAAMFAFGAALLFTWLGRRARHDEARHG